jgi:hypothetical protein
MKNKFILFLAFSLMIGGINPASANTIYMDNKCNQNPNLGQYDRFRIFYQAEFKVSNQSYWFYAGRYQDGAVLFCLSHPNFQKPKALTELTEINARFIDNIVQDTNDNTIFLVTEFLAGRDTLMTEYRVSFANPNQPEITKLKSMRVPHSERLK